MPELTRGLWNQDFFSKNFRQPRKLQGENEMRHDTAIALSLAIGLASVTPAVEGQVFKCKGEDGKVTYTDVPCLRSEASSVVDTRSNVADHSSLRKEATRPQSNENTTPPPAQTQAASQAPPPPGPVPTSERRPSGYSR